MCSQNLEKQYNDKWESLKLLSGTRSNEWCMVSFKENFIHELERHLNFALFFNNKNLVKKLAIIWNLANKLAFS